MKVAVMFADIKDLKLKIKAMQERLSISSVFLHQECSSANSAKGFVEDSGHMMHSVVLPLKIPAMTTKAACEGESCSEQKLEP